VTEKMYVLVAKVEENTKTMNPTAEDKKTEYFDYTS